MLNADPSKVSARAKKRGLPQVSLLDIKVLSKACKHRNALFKSSTDLSCMRLHCAWLPKQIS